MELARTALEPELTALAGEAYARAYKSIVKVQQLTELEEVAKYQQLPDDKRAAPLERNQILSKKNR